MNEEAKQLDLLAVFHYIIGAFTALFACFPLIHVAIGVAILTVGLDGPHPPPPVLGWVFVVLGGVFVLCGWVLSAAILVAGRKLQKRKFRTYCLVVAALECLLMPFGTILGVLTILLLMKDATQTLFEGGAPAAAVAPPPAP